MGDILPTRFVPASKEATFNNPEAFHQQLLSTHQRMILNLPTTLADMFEFLAACQIEEDGAPEDGGHAVWSLFQFLHVSDILVMRRVCRSTA